MCFILFFYFSLFSLCCNEIKKRSSSCLRFSVGAAISGDSLCNCHIKMKSTGTKIYLSLIQVFPHVLKSFIHNRKRDHSSFDHHKKKKYWICFGTLLNFSVWYLFFKNCSNIYRYLLILIIMCVTLAWTARLFLGSGVWGPPDVCRDFPESCRVLLTFLSCCSCSSAAGCWDKLQHAPGLGIRGS